MIATDYKRYSLAQYGKFDVIYMNPPLPEYTENLDIADPNKDNYSIGGFYSQNYNYPFSMKYSKEDEDKLKLHPSLYNSHSPWSYEELKYLPIKEISESQWFIFMWIGSGEYLEKGRDLLKHWGFRRWEDIVLCLNSNSNSDLKSNKEIIHDNDERLFKRTKEHWLVGIKGTVRRVSDTHLIHTNIDTDVIIGNFWFFIQFLDKEESNLWSIEKPDEIFDIIERFSLGRKKIQLFGSKNTLRKGWLTTMHNDITKNCSKNFDWTYSKDVYEGYFKEDVDFFRLKDFNGGRYTGTTPEIESLRPRTPAT